MTQKGKAYAAYEEKCHCEPFEVVNDPVKFRALMVGAERWQGTVKTRLSYPASPDGTYLLADGRVAEKVVWPMYYELRVFASRESWERHNPPMGWNEYWE